MQHSTVNMYIGDPCYVIRDSDWQEFCNIFFETRENTGSSSFWMNFKNQMCYVMETSHGDGTYTLTNPHDIATSEIFVDSGLIACVPRSIISNEIQNQNYNLFFYDNINTEHISSEDGILYADDYRCDTNTGSDDNDYDDECEEYYNDYLDSCNYLNSCNDDDC